MSTSTAYNLCKRATTFLCFSSSWLVNCLFSILCLSSRTMPIFICAVLLSQALRNKSAAGFKFGCFSLIKSQMGNRDCGDTSRSMTCQERLLTRRNSSNKRGCKAFGPRTVISERLDIFEAWWAVDDEDWLVSISFKCPPTLIREAYSKETAAFISFLANSLSDVELCSCWAVSSIEWHNVPPSWWRPDEKWDPYWSRNDSAVDMSVMDWRLRSALIENINWSRSIL